MSAASASFKLGIASVLIPAAFFLVSIGLQALIPGCYCDEGSGCHGCGLNDVMSFAMFGGFVGAVAAAVVVFPACIVFGMVFAMFSKK